MSRNYRLYLVCQHPPGPHQVRESYQLRKSKDWWITVGPWLNHLINFLKFAVPMGKAVGVVVEAVDILPDIKQIQANIDLLEQITQDLPDVASYNSMKDVNEKKKQTNTSAQLVLLCVFYITFSLKPIPDRFGVDSIRHQLRMATFYGFATHIDSSMLLSP